MERRSSSGWFHSPSGWQYLERPCPLVELRVDGQAIAASDLAPIPPATAGQDLRWFRVRSIDGLRLGVSVKIEGGDCLRIAAAVKNEGGLNRRVLLRAPSLAYRLTPRPEDSLYLVPKCGAVMDHRDGRIHRALLGAFPLAVPRYLQPRRGPRPFAADRGTPSAFGRITYSRSRPTGSPSAWSIPSRRSDRASRSKRRRPC